MDSVFISDFCFHSVQCIKGIRGVSNRSCSQHCAGGQQLLIKCQTATPGRCQCMSSCFSALLGRLWDAISSRVWGALIRTPQMKEAPCSHLVCTTCRSQIPPLCAAAATVHSSVFKQISHKTHPVKTRGKHIPHTEGSWIKTLPALIKYCVRHSPGTTLFKELSVDSMVANIQDTFKVNRLGKHLISLLPSAESRQAGFPGRVKHSEIPWNLPSFSSIPALTPVLLWGKETAVENKKSLWFT